MSSPSHASLESDSPFLQDIQSQPEALATLLDSPVTSAVDGLNVAGFNRIVLTGMGASHNAAYPAWTDLVAAGVPAWWVSTDELLPISSGLIDARTLVVLTSQSGRSAETVELIRVLRDQPGRRATVVGVTNDTASPLAEAADRVVDVASGPEAAVSTRSYVNTLAALHLVADALVGRPSRIGELAETRDRLTSFFAGGVGDLLARIDDAVPSPPRLVLLGRGAGLSAALNGALVIKEAAKFQAEAMSCSQFRHGPLEIADPGLSVVLVASDSADLDRRLAGDLMGFGARVAWVGPQVPPEFPALPTPRYVGIGRGISQVVPLQLLSVTLAVSGGRQPGVFRNGSKVTTEL